MCIFKMDEYQIVERLQDLFKQKELLQDADIYSRYKIYRKEERLCKFLYFKYLKKVKLNPGEWFMWQDIYGNYNFMVVTNNTKGRVKYDYYFRNSVEDNWKFKRVKRNQCKKDVLKMLTYHFVSQVDCECAMQIINERGFVCSE